MVTEFMTTGVLGLSLPSVETPEIFKTTSMPEVTLPKTGCWLGVDLSYQSRKLLWTVFTKNCEPPEFGWPVLAMERVPGSFESLAVNSSGMLPPRSRVMVSPPGVV